MNVELHIERLVLDGLPLAPGEEKRLRAAVTAELGRLLRHGGLDPGLAAGGARPRLAAGVLRATPRHDTEQLGAGVARALYEGLGPRQRAGGGKDT